VVDERAGQQRRVGAGARRRVYGGGRRTIEPGVAYTHVYRGGTSVQ
jgi:hypothetical protein